MPVSLNTEELLVYKQIQSQAESFVKAKPKTTVKMVEDALINLHNVKGVTLKKIYSYLLDNYNLELISKIREGLIKKYLKSLWGSGDVVNITGNGLSGHFKLVEKKKFSRKIKNTTKRPFISAPVESNSKIYNSKQSDRFTAERKKKAKILKNTQLLSLAYDIPVIPRQVTPVPLNLHKSSIFETPMVPTQVKASTPFLSSLIPRAPEVRKKFHKTQKKNMPHDEIGTPRSSLPGKRRKLLSRHEK